MSAPSTPVPIAFCITELDRGGAERALCQLVLGLDRRAWLPRVYCLGPRGHFADVLEAGGVTVECFDGRGLLSFPRVLIRLTRALRRFRPALLQTFLFHGNLLGRIAARLASVPIVVSGIRVADRRSRWYGRWDRWTNGLVDHNVCVSQGVAAFAINESGLNPGKISVIPNGVNCELFARAQPTDLSPFGIRPEVPVVITVGRLEEQKGIAYLLRAAVDVLRERTDSRFLIVGDGPDRASLEALAASLGIAESVTFTGVRSDVPGLLKAADVFVLPSLWEGMPNALLEAMAAGLPCIATAVEGSQEVIESDVTGLLVSPANSAQLSQAILRLFRAPDDAARFAAAAQSISSKYFTETLATAAYDRLYRKLLSQR
jgi:glycosyltransferase involved in cell wall biosynthesis